MASIQEHVSTMLFNNNKLKDMMEKIFTYISISPKNTCFETDETINSYFHDFLSVIDDSIMRMFDEKQKQDLVHLLKSTIMPIFTSGISMAEMNV